MTEMLDLETSNWIILDHSDLDKIVWEYFAVPYESINSIEELHNDTLLKYTLDDDYYDLIEELDEWEEAIQKWKDTALQGINLSGIKAFLHMRDNVDMLNWKIMLTILISEGRIPQSDYLLNTAW